MTHLLDTNICVFLIRHRSEELRRRVEAFEVGDLSISAVTESELRHGASKSADPRKNHSAVDRLLLTLPVLAYDSQTAAEYGEIRADLERSGSLIGSMDMLIAAHARAACLTLVTNNLSEFSRVAGLKVEDWSS